MDDQRWQAVKACVGQALEQAPTLRATWLHAACAGDPDLLCQAETLLKAAAFTGDLLSVSSTPASSDTSAAPGTDAGTRRRLLGTIGHYQLKDWLGAGGMGEVFLARDLALGRDVALKLLPQRFTPELRFRLMREAEACAKVQHPAIATFYETGEANGEAFIAMEYVHGDTLRRRLAGGPLPVSECVAIARCLLEALEHAHAAGILHRDIKPENVMVTGPRSAKLLDFGLAKHLLAAAPAIPDAAPTGIGAITLTTDTGLAGTIGYMAPEQLLQESLDERTDVFQVGAVLYEMLSGRPAFCGKSPLDSMAAVMMRDADFDALEGARMPPAFQAVLRRALARDRSGRQPTAASLLRDIEDVLEGRVITDLPKVLAVLEFENLTGDAESNWMGSAVTDAIRTSLARVSGLTVIAREKTLGISEALRTIDGSTEAVAAGLRLGCGWVVSGSVQRSGAAVTVTARLVEVSTARNVASETMDCRVDDLFSMHDALVNTIASSLGYSASPGTGPRTTADVQEFLARAQLLLDRLDKGAVEQARELLERAVAIDGHYAPVLSALANAYGFRSIARPDPEDLERALQFASRAIDADPGSADAHMWRGYALLRQNRRRARAGERDRSRQSGGTVLRRVLAPLPGAARSGPAAAAARARSGSPLRNGVACAGRHTSLLRFPAGSAPCLHSRVRDRGPSRAVSMFGRVRICRGSDAARGRCRRRARSCPRWSRVGRAVGPCIPRYFPGVRARRVGPERSGRRRSRGRAGRISPSAQPESRPAAHAVVRARGGGGACRPGAGR